MSGVRTIDVAITPAAIAARPPAGVAVVIDVLRATSTIATALANGASGVIPVREPDEAIATMKRIGRDRVLLCGERASRLITGFDLDNSPASYTAAAVRGKTLAFTTTNGTRALIDAARDGAVVYCGALLNRGAIAHALRAGEAADALLVCAGNEGTLSFEDLLCAGAIVTQLYRADRTLQRSDAARAAMTVYEANAKQLITAIAFGTHARALRDAGFAADVAACAQLDVLDVVPVYRDGLITPLERTS
jgi:2-phosphosulfolactate phosphatase